MKKVLPILVVGIFVLSGLGAVGISNDITITSNNDNNAVAVSAKSASITFTPLVISYYSPLRLIILLILVINLLIKIQYEEKILLKNLKGYKAYKIKTYKLIPFIF